MTATADRPAAREVPRFALRLRPGGVVALAFRLPRRHGLSLSVSTIAPWRYVPALVWAALRLWWRR